MTTAALTSRLTVIDHAEIVATFVVRNFFSLAWSGWMLVSSCLTRYRAAELGFPPTNAWGPIAIFASCFFMPLLLASLPVARKHRPTDADDVLRWCEIIPLGESRGALWIQRDGLRLIGSGYDESLPFRDIRRVEARVQGPFSVRARLLGQTQPLVLTKRDGTEVSLIVAAPTSIARSIRRAAGLA